MCNRGILLPASQIGLKSFSEKLLWGPLKYTWDWMTNRRPLINEDLVFIGLLREMAELVVRHISNKSCHSFSALFSFDSFQRLTEELRLSQGLCRLSDEDVKLLISYMKEKDMLASSDSVLRVRLLKEKGPLSISEDQKNIVKLQNAAVKIGYYIEELNKKIEEQRNAIHQCLKIKDRSRALYFLKKSKQYESARIERLSCLESIENILFKIENSHSDNQVLEAYQLGERTLKSMLSSLPSANVVDDLLVSIQESIEDSNIFGQSLVQQSLVEDAELEEELNELILPTSPPSTTPKLHSEPAMESLGYQLEQLEIKSPSPTQSQSIQPIAL